MAVGRGLQVGGATAVVLWGHPQLGLLLLTLTDPQESRPQAKDGIDTSSQASGLCSDHGPGANVKPWELATANGDHSDGIIQWQAEPLDPCPQQPGPFDQDTGPRPR